MNAHNDPTAWAAIAHVMREGRKRPKPKPPPKHGDTAFYIARKKGTGKQIKINKAELAYSRMRKAIDDSQDTQSVL